MRYLLYTLLLTALTATATAEILLQNPWTRATPKGASTAAIYFQLVNTGEEDIMLTEADIPTADRVELHTMKESEHGHMMMQRLDGVMIRAGESVRFQPGGLHVMVINLEQPFKTGLEVPLTLRFSNDTFVNGRVPVRSLTFTPDDLPEPEVKHHNPAMAH